MKKLVGLFLVVTMFVFSFVGCAIQPVLDELKELATQEVNNYLAEKGEFTNNPEKWLIEDVIDSYFEEISKITKIEQIDYLIETTEKKLDDLVGMIEGTFTLELTDERKAQIEDEIFAKTGVREELSYNFYYGNHSGADVFIKVGTELIDGSFVLADTVFRLGVEFDIFVVKEGTVYTLAEAYENGVITAKDVMRISCYHALGVKSEYEGTDAEFEAWYFNTEDITNK